jgi:hypothetical protein
VTNHDSRYISDRVLRSDRKDTHNHSRISRAWAPRFLRYERIAEEQREERDKFDGCHMPQNLSVIDSIRKSGVYQVRLSGCASVLKTILSKSNVRVGAKIR